MLREYNFENVPLQAACDLELGLIRVRLNYCGHKFEGPYGGLVGPQDPRVGCS